MRKFLSVSVLTFLFTIVSIAQVTPELIRAYQQRDVHTFAKGVERTLGKVGYPCDVKAEKRYEATGWDFICNFHRSYVMQLDVATSEIWGLLGAVCGNFYWTKYTTWKSDRVWIATKGKKIAYLTTADCRRLYVYLKRGEDLKLMSELLKCLVIAVDDIEKNK